MVLFVLRYVLFLNLVLILNGSGRALADPVYPDGMVRAAVIFGILRFTDWPDDRISNNEVLLCAIGTSPSEEAISSLAQLPSIGEHRLRYRAMPASLAQTEPCQAAILGRDAPETLRLSQSVLLICDECQSGMREQASVTLARKGGRIQFEVNLDRVRAQRISLSASLIELASRCVSSEQRVRGCND